MTKIKEITPQELAQVFKRQSYWRDHLDDRIRDTTVEMIASGKGLEWIAAATEPAPWYLRWLIGYWDVLGFTAIYKEGEHYWGLTVVKRKARGTGLGKELVNFRRDRCPIPFKVKIGASNWKSIKSCINSGMALTDAMPVENPEEEYPDIDPVVLVMEYDKPRSPSSKTEGPQAHPR